MKWYSNLKGSTRDGTVDLLTLTGGWECQRRKVPANAEYLWADGADPAAKITKDHDPYMLEKTFLLMHDLDE